MAEEMMVNEQLGTIGLYELDVNLDRAIQVLTEWKERHPNKGLSLDLRSTGYDDDKEYVVTWHRPENEKEKAERLGEEEARRAYRRAEYERLKKEFET